MTLVPRVLLHFPPFCRSRREKIRPHLDSLRCTGDSFSQSFSLRLSFWRLNLNPSDTRRNKVALLSSCPPRCYAGHSPRPRCLPLWREGLGREVHSSGGPIFSGRESLKGGGGVGRCVETGNTPSFLPSYSPSLAPLCKALLLRQQSRDQAAMTRSSRFAPSAAPHPPAASV